MEIKLFNSQEFIIVYQDILNSFEAELQLWFRNLDVNKELSKDEIRGGVYLNNELSLLFLNAYPFNLQLSSLKDDELAFEYLIRYLIDNKIQINGIQGNLKDLEIFKKIYYKYQKINIIEYLKMDILKLTKLNKIDSYGSILKANNKHFDLLVGYYDNFLKDAMGEELDLNSIKEKVLCNLNSTYLYINKEGKITSMLKVIKSLPNGVSISFVYTEKEERNKGYAKEMMYLVCQELLKEYQYITLFVDKTNPISNKVYEDIGFAFLDENYDYRIE